VTTADGRFRVRGVGRDRVAVVAVEGTALAPTTFRAATSPPAGARDAPIDYVVAPSRPIRGVVRDKQTGAPVAGVKVSLQRSGLAAITDGTGRYELLAPSLNREAVVAQPQRGQLYFAAAVLPEDEPPPGPLLADFALPRGVPLRGRVTDHTTGRRPKRVVVEYYPLPANEHLAGLPSRSRMVPASSSDLGPDGSYSLAVLPGPGIVLVAASPRDSYATARLDDKEWAALFKGTGGRGASAWAHIAVRPLGSPARAVDRYNALALINPDDRAGALTLDFTLRRARPLHGRVVGPDGEPLAGVQVSGLTSMPDAELLGTAAFTVEGLCPRVARPLSFFHPEKQLGKALTLRGDETEALTVRLEPCGVVVGRVVDKAGHPVSGQDLWFGRLDNGLSSRARTGLRGEFRAPLVPRLKYHLLSRRLADDVGELEVGPGQTKDLGHLLTAD
jgi:hypothetical protein